ncbi:carbohydrate-binding protein [Pseudonocardiaceae bacterium YIM PH 21723]|nr:carbohydrate-binding protein [Pseudonocardiaceae bacterium YIM PH 21723]
MNSLVEDVLAHAVQRPDAPALRWHGNDVGYPELAGLVERATATLDAAPGTGPIAVAAAKSPETIAFVLACVQAGRPVLLPAADLGAEALDDLLTRTGCRQIATATDAGIALRETAVTTDPGDPVRFLLTTSGSTGRPKVVPLDAAATERFMDWAIAEFGLGPDSTVFNYAPLNFDLCLLDIWATLRAGGRVTLVDSGHAVNARYLMDLLDTGEPHVIQAVPMFFRILAEAAEDRGYPDVRHVVLTGDHTPRALRAALPGIFPNARFHNIYGCTETNDSFLHSFDGAEAAARDVVPLGNPLPGVTALLMTDEGELTGPGTGELWVTTPFQTRGYLGEAADRFVAGPGGHTFFRSGDLVHRDAEGELTLVGRTDFQVKVRGVRVSIEDIERVIAEHDQVAEVGVVALPDPEAGQRLHAVVRGKDARLTGLGLRRHCAARLARAAIPSHIQIVERALPLTSTGKVNRKLIKETLLAGEV